MKTVKITALRAAHYDDLIEKYENPIEHACSVKVGQVFFSINGEKPEGFCDEAWSSMEKFVKTLAMGGGDFFDGWMKNKYSALISCNDGFRPVSFLLEAQERPECITPYRELRFGERSIYDDIEVGHDTQETVISYLKRGELYIVSPGIYEHPFIEGKTLLGPTIVSDGVFCWDSNTAEYVEKFGLKLPENFIRYVMRDDS